MIEQPAYDISIFHLELRDPTDAAKHDEMLQALKAYHMREISVQPPREKAFYSALRSVLTDCINDKDEYSRHLRLTAGHQWFVKHKPRPRIQQPDWAAAMATSLSVPTQKEAEHPCTSIQALRASRSPYHSAAGAYHGELSCSSSDHSSHVCSSSDEDSRDGQHSHCGSQAWAPPRRWKQTAYTTTHWRSSCSGTASKQAQHSQPGGR
jgi:hypothetical protein